jgi:hypothetical protein
LLLLFWAPTLAVPRLVHRPLGAVAAASLGLYLTHWQLYPPLLRAFGPAAAFVGSVLAGVVGWGLATGLRRLLRRRGPLRRPATSGRR